ncbi:MAG: amidohydrolase family protein [Isosphaeraceae bacterium]|nr:amidohydrolase family protein [Isosphaeraceae bacterium]
MIDVNIFLSRWPFRRLPQDEPEALVRKLRAQGVEQAWAGSFEALLHEDLAAVNTRLVETCRQYGDGLLVPFGAVNPRLPGWREDLNRCQEDHGMPGVRLHPDYHGYALDDPIFQELLEAAAERKLIVQVSLRMEDARTQHPALRLAPVDATPIAALLPQVPRLRLILLNALGDVRGVMLDRLVAAGVSFDIAMLEGVGGIERFLAQYGADRLLFGSYAPLFYHEAATLKLRESALEPNQREAIVSGNARRLLDRR